MHNVRGIKQRPLRGRCFYYVEMGGVEPPSENDRMNASTVYSSSFDLNTYP